jgi:hypothetical protein
MFEFISKILVTLTPAQRLWALTIVLLSIVVITLGPGWIDRNDCSDLYPIVKNQKEEIASLNKEILGVQKECTSIRVQRETEIRELVAQLEIEISKLGATQRQMLRKTYTTQDTISVDSLNPYRMVIRDVQEIPAPMDLTKIKHFIQCIKDKVNEK